MSLMYGSPSPATSSTDLNRPFPPPLTTNQMSSGSGLLRYRSAPSSVLGELLCENFLPVNRPSVPDTESMFACFLSQDNPPPSAATSGGGSGAGAQRSAQFPPPMYQKHQHHQIQNQMAAVTSVAMNSGETKNGGGGGGNCSNLVRHSSSPAGLFDNLQVENGYGVMMSGIGGYRNGNESRLKRQSSSTAGLMSQISEIDEESIGSYGLGSWEEQGRRDNQTEKGGCTLNHQLSLSKTSSEMSAIEKFLQFQDSVPCKIRAKRGCATHPRSIAERVRRTKISERMRKLQELVPNMDKQTNTADMLDFAVDYIKGLQKLVKTISDRRANCTCSGNDKQK